MGAPSARNRALRRDLLTVLSGIDGPVPTRTLVELAAQRGSISSYGSDYLKVYAQLRVLAERQLIVHLPQYDDGKRNARWQRTAAGIAAAAQASTCPDPEPEAAAPPRAEVGLGGGPLSGSLSEPIRAVLEEHQRQLYYRGEGTGVSCKCGWSRPSRRRGDSREMFLTHQAIMVAEALSDDDRAHAPRGPVARAKVEHGIEFTGLDGRRSVHRYPTTPASVLWKRISTAADEDDAAHDGPPSEMIVVVRTVTYGPWEPVQP